MILALKTESKDAYIAVVDKAGAVIAEKTWLAHRQLSVDIHEVIESLLKQAGSTKKDIEGVVVFKGPGSFTGLRISVSVANAIGYALKVPVVGVMGEDWLKSGIDGLDSTPIGKIVLPEYGGEPNITKPRK
jgi:tRNA threonylcarbamoyladenosine biosynthesis protein TsaB